MKRLWATLHEAPGNTVPRGALGAGWLKFRLTGSGAVRLCLGEEQLITLAIHQADALYAGQSLVVPGGRLLRLHSSPEQVVPLEDVYERSLERMHAELEEILTASS